MLYFLLFITFVSLVLQVFYWLFVFGKFAFHRFENTPLPHSFQQGVSVIICAKNEARNLVDYLPYILNQQYRLFEVIVVNDGSTDNTEKVLQQFLLQHPQLKVITIPENNEQLLGKRNALLKGIEAAQYEWLAFTDADCKPASNTWLQYIIAPLHQGKKISIGYSPYFLEKTFLNKLIQYETFYTALQYFSFALVGMPYMAVGRNMAYTKSFFHESNKFHQTQSISGDDDLLVNELITKNNFRLVLNENSFVYSKPKENWQSWWQQKIRHLGAGKYYKLNHRIVLATLHISALLFIICIGFQAFAAIHYAIPLSIFIWIATLQFVVSYVALKKFNNAKMLIWASVLNFLFPMILITLATISMFTNTISWKKD